MTVRGPFNKLVKYCNRLSYAFKVYNCLSGPTFLIKDNDCFCKAAKYLQNIANNIDDYANIKFTGCMHACSIRGYASFL